ncbi:MAG: RagB/SusD family nutrient uptake outer membrane protein [Bacteroidales bacterium]|nr:RagB/SusD family nutrient uptake outer membrane protein [Bacteroidales bacterium]
MKAKLLIIILSLFTVTGCEVLDVEPSSLILDENAIVDLKSLQFAVNGAYNELQSTPFAEDGIIFGDLTADNWIHVGSKKEYAQIDNYQLLATNIYVEGIWNSCYDGINIVNNILHKIETLENVSEQDKNYYQGQCLFLRGLNYSVLVKYFGGVPLKLEPTTSTEQEALNIARASLTETYNQILTDLSEAELLLGEFDFNKNPSYADVFAVKALMARVYLYMSEFENHWQDAADKANEVIQSGNYSLQDSSSYGEIFSESNISEEIIFQIDFKNDDDQNAIADWTNANGSRIEVEAWDSKEKENSIYDAFESFDLRLDATVIEASGNYYSAKYSDLVEGKDNVILLRLAEMYLIRAEALNEVAYVPDGEAFDMLSAITARAGLGEVDASNYPTSNAFRLAVEKQRRLELAFEGHRFFDLRRTGRINDILPSTGNMDENGWLFPIPQSEIDTNELIEQNGNY